MGDKAESEHSYSSESSSSSDSSSGSSEAEEEVMEPVRILGQTLELPQELCEDYDLFKEFFSMKTWDALSDEQKEHLKEYLPKFPDNEKEEKDKTIKMLFNHEPFCFTSPFGHFFKNLKHGNYRPDIAKMRKFLKKARAKQQRHRRKKYFAKLLPDLIVSRERLLAVVKGLPPGSVPLLPMLGLRPSSKNKYKPLYQRIKQRYFEELAAIKSEVGGDDSDDENYLDGPPEQLMKKKSLTGSQTSDGNVSGTLSGTDSSSIASLDCLKKVLSTHKTRRQYRENHPELNIAGITLDDIKQRVALVNGAKKLMFGSRKSDSPAQKLKRGPKKESGAKQGKTLEGKGGKKKEETAAETENRPLLPNIKLKSEPEPEESDSESSSFVDPVSSPRQSKKPFEPVEIKEEIIDNSADTNMDIVIKEEPLDPVAAMNAARVIQHVPIKLEDLDGIDMMALPVEIADESGEVMSMDSSQDIKDEPVLDPDDALTETTHANFLSLVRALFPARAAHRATKSQLYARCVAVMKSPIAPLNTWYNLSDDWCAELDSALSFLAGERGPHPDDFVPYLQFMPETQVYQWIGAGRDCDALLGRLCERWLHTAAPPMTHHTHSQPPPPKYPTTWVVRPATPAEVLEFRTQERKRFAAAARPFTYIQHGYRSVVGPCCMRGSAAGGGGGGGVLAGNRPRHATLLALVRDALARLPNGQGSRHDVLVLLRMSQWIAPCSEQALLTAVTSALDRLLAAKREPFVKYDQRTAIWTYLYRHRSEEDWLKTTTGRSRAPKVTPLVAAPTAPAAPAVPPPPPAAPAVGAPPRAAPAPVPAAAPSPPHAIEMEVASVEEIVDNGSDTDVDVDDSTSPSSVPHLSSAQLLMQATQVLGKAQAPANKPKGKLIAVSPTKAKGPKQPGQTKPPAPQKQTVPAPQTSKPAPTKPATSPKPPQLPQKPPPQSKPTVTPAKLSSLSPKQANLMSQAVKQASLMAQSAKQASVIAQLTKAAQKPQLVQAKQVNVVKQPAQSPQSGSSKQVAVQNKPVQAKQTPVAQKQEAKVTPLGKTAVLAVPPPQKSPLIKQRPLQKQTESSAPVPMPTILAQQSAQALSAAQIVTAVSVANQNKLVQGTRSLLIRAPAIQTTVTAVASTPTSQVTPTQRRGIVRVLTPAAPSGGKSLISPRALLQQSPATSKKRATTQEGSTVTTVAQCNTATAVVSSVPTVVTSSIPTRTVQLAGGRTVQLANQTVHLPGGQAVQLSSGHTLQLSSLQLPTHSVKLPSGQTVQLASPQTIRVSATTANVSSPRSQPSSPIVKTAQSPALQIPISSVQLAGQTVQIAGQTVQLAGQSVQLTGHTVKLPSGQSVQVASQNVLPSQSVQLPSGQTVQLAGGSVQTVQLGQNVIANQGGTVQTVQLPSGQTFQLSGGQTVQLSGGQTFQLGGQSVQLAAGKGQARPHTALDKCAQPIVAKLLTNAQGQMLSLEGGGVCGVGGGARSLQVSGVRVLSPAAAAVARMPRPLLLTATKPLHNRILQQGDGSTIRVTSSGGAATTQTIVLTSIAGAHTATSSATSAPVLKLQQASSSSAGTSGVRSVVMDAQQLKLVGGRHVLARILRPTQPPHQPQ